MALTITYGTLATLVLNIIKSRCRNIDSNSNLDQSLRPAGSGWAKTIGKLSGTPYAYCTITVNDTTAWGGVVTTANLEANFRTYMTTCGIYAKYDT